MSGCWRDLGVTNMWAMMGVLTCLIHSDKLTHDSGNLALSRFHSKHVALRKYMYFFCCSDVSLKPVSFGQRSKR